MNVFHESLFTFLGQENLERGVLEQRVRWTAAAESFSKARSKGVPMPILFGDARDCADLYAWAELSDVRLTGEGTTVRWGKVHVLEGRRSQELIKLVDRKPLPLMIRGQVSCETPPFLVEATVDLDDPALAKTSLDVRKLVGPGVDVRRPVLHRLAQAVGTAAALRGDCWSLTHKPDLVRLNVGWVEMLTIIPGLASLTLVGEPDRKALAKVGAVLSAGYELIPGSFRVSAPHAAFAHAFDVVHTQHVAALRTAAMRTPPPQVKKAHSPALVAYLARATGKTLPAPRWREDVDEVAVAVAVAPSPTEHGPTDATATEEAFQAQANALARSCTKPGADVPLPPTAPLDASRRSWPRDPRVAAEALARAGGSCEAACGVPAFRGRAGGSPYLEAHHLVPLARQGSYGSRLDVPANVVALCPRCHSLLHHASKDDVRKVLARLYNARRQRLKATGIRVSRSDLVAAYDVAHLAPKIREEDAGRPASH
jgi:5-methylcytosine-specific restriction endonuclease McrA